MKIDAQRKCNVFTFDNSIENDSFDTVMPVGSLAKKLLEDAQIRLCEQNNYKKNY